MNKTLVLIEKHMSRERDKILVCESANFHGDKRVVPRISTIQLVKSQTLFVQPSGVIPLWQPDLRCLLLTIACTTFLYAPAFE